MKYVMILLASFLAISAFANSVEKSIETIEMMSMLNRFLISYHGNLTLFFSGTDNLARNHDC